MRHLFNWLLGEPLPKHTPPKRPPRYKVESSFYGFSYIWEDYMCYSSLDRAKEEMDKLIQEDKYKYYRIVRF
jgi:hypothetical protein